jgi:hypothetical protein
MRLQDIRITDAFWSSFTRLVRETVIPYQWEALNDRVPEAEPSHAIRNFRIAAGLEQGEFGGMVFQDSDVAKWLEAVGHSLAAHPDPELERIADGVIDLVVAAQHEDGYLNTYFTVKEPGRRWTNLTDCHELYCAGHMIEAAVAYYEATGKRKLLDAMCRFADHIDSVFGPENGKLRGYDGHQEIELALVKLYRVTGNERYLRLSRFFIEERGKKPNFFLQEFGRPGYERHWEGVKGKQPDLAYHQAHEPVREQDTAVGHAVRAVYMYTAMADLARELGDASLAEACRRLWRNVTRRQMYITGGIGSTHHGEAFTFDYDLPNDTVYAETCASIGLIFFANRMLRLEPKAEYADVMERALYNIVIGSMAADGKHYFYVNPLEVWPDACRRNPGKHHVKPVRQRWFGCACCPPNLARLIASLGGYIWTREEDALYAHLYIGNETAVSFGGRNVRVRMTSDLPWEGAASLSVETESPVRFRLALRLPAWMSGEACIRLNGDVVRGAPVRDGYLMIDREWRSGDTVDLSFPMEAEWMEAHPDVRADRGKVALVRGPLVYCFEEADNGPLIAALSVSPDAKPEVRMEDTPWGRIGLIRAEGWRDDPQPFGDELYRRARKAKRPVTLTAIPYYLWGNRGEGEMAVWIRSAD